MKYPVAFLLVLLLVSSAGAQTPSLSNLPSAVIELPGSPGPAYTGTSPFNRFSVIDERPDTARIGLHTSAAKMSFYRPHQIVFPGPAAQTISSWFNQHFTSPGAPWSILIVLRTLWLADANYLREEMIRNPDLREAKSYIRLKAEVYAVKDNQFMPLFRLDTVQFSQWPSSGYMAKPPYSGWNKDLSGILIDLASRAALLSRQKDGHSRLLSLTDIEAFNRSRFQLPIQSDAALTQGVYASFDEFKHNTPSILKWKIEKEGKDQLLYLTDSTGKQYYCHDSWGLCDGKNVYVMWDGKLLPMWREGNAWYFYANAEKETLTRKNTTSQPSIPGQTDVANTPEEGDHRVSWPNMNGSYDRKHVIYTIDMDSGATY